MSALRAWLLRVGASAGCRRAPGDDFADEMDSHLALHSDENERAGMSPDEARRLARARVGSLVALQQAHRDRRRFRPADAAARDLRHALRLLGRGPLFTTVAVTLLALGIGANLTVFTIANALLLRPLPVTAPDRLALLEGGSWTYPIFDALRQADLGVEGIAAWANAPDVVRIDGRAERDEVQFVSGGFFEVMGMAPMIGRTIGTGDDRRAGGVAGPVAVLSHAYWQRRLSGDPAVLSRSLEIQGITFTVVGVMPPGFHGPEVGRAFDVAIPFGTEPLLRGDGSVLDRRSTWWLEVMFRLGPGQSLEAAQDRLRAAQPAVRSATMPAHYLTEQQDDYLASPLTITSAATGRSPMRDRYRQPLTILAMTAALVLCVACANLANLLLARGAARRPEMSMRLALGASRTRLVAQLLLEGLLLSTLGAIVGLGVAWGSGRVIVGLLSTADRPVHLDLFVDWRVQAFTVVAACIAGLLSALVPAVRSTRVVASEALKEQSRAVAGESRLLMGHALLAAQVSLSLALVVVAALLVRTFTTLAAQPLGFAPEGLVVAHVEFGRDAATGDQRAAFADRLDDVASAVPGAERVSLSMYAPMSGAGWNGAVATIDGRELPGTDRERMVWYNAVSPEFFRTYGTALREGRPFTVDDRRGTPGVAIVNDAFVRAYVSGGEPVGRLIHDGTPDGVVRTIVGRVADARYLRDLRRDPPPTVYLPHAQLEDVGGHVVVSVRARDSQLVPLRRGLVQALESAGQPVSVRTQLLTDYVAGAVSQERLLATVAGFFGVLALGIAGVGLYGVTAYSVERRRGELGIRLTLGATPKQIVGLVFARVGLVVGAGLVGGVALALWLGTYVGVLLHGLEPSDPATLALAAGVLGITATLAALVPAWRAARTDPATVLRES